MNARGRRQVGGATAAAAVAAMVAGCGVPAAGGSAAGVPGLDVPGPVDTLVEAAIAAAAEIGGPTVDDVGVRLDTASSTLWIGGLPVMLPLFADYYLSLPNTTVPSQWPVYEPLEFRMEGELRSATFGVGVFDQSTIVTDPVHNSRDALFNLGFLRSRMLDAPLIHESSHGDPDVEIACWMQVRYGEATGLEGLGILFPIAVVLVAGPGIAASGTIIHAGSFRGVPELTADFVEAACGVRPEIPTLDEVDAANAAAASSLPSDTLST